MCFCRAKTILPTPNQGVGLKKLATRFLWTTAADPFLPLVIPAGCMPAALGNELLFSIEKAQLKRKKLLYWGGISSSLNKAKIWFGVIPVWV
jgi:hypothetical protein